MDPLTLNTTLLGALCVLIGYLGQRALKQLDEVVDHLAILNHRTEKLEARMTDEEARE